MEVAVSDKTNVYLSIIRNGLWPAELPRYDWRGEVAETWQYYVGDNKHEEILTKLANRTLKEKRQKDPDIRFGNFVYMWEFDILGRTYHKVGVTHDVHQRFRVFKNSIPIMGRCEICRLTPIRHREIALRRETAFIVAARDYWAGGEWFDFSVS